MKIVQINVTANQGSTGKICYAISSLLQQEGIENYIFYTSGYCDDDKAVKFGSDKYIKWQALKSRILGYYGFNSKSITKKMLAKLDEIKPDVVALHNLHGHNVNLDLLFNYFKKHPEIKIVWTMHDCWAITGHCPYFTMVKCGSWRSGCGSCPQRKQYSWFFDRTRCLYDRKKALFTGLNMTIVTPSHWLEGIIKESFLKSYPVEVIYNGIDLNVFKPVKNDFRDVHGLNDKKVVLGVAYGWGKRKGFSDMMKLSQLLDDSFRIVLVGVNKEQIAGLPDNVIGIERTDSQKELAAIYSAADVFINTTYEDNYPTVNLEARACGAPVITYRTGGSPESAGRDAVVVECGDVEGLKEAIVKTVPENRPVNVDIDEISQDVKFRKYVDLYETGDICP